MVQRFKYVHWQQSDSYWISRSLTTSVFDLRVGGGTFDVSWPFRRVSSRSRLPPVTLTWVVKISKTSSWTTSFKSSSTRTRTSGAFMVSISCLFSPMPVSQSRPCRKTEGGLTVRFQGIGLIYTVFDWVTLTVRPLGLGSEEWHLQDRTTSNGCQCYVGRRPQRWGCRPS